MVYAMMRVRRRIGQALIAALAWTVPNGIWTCFARADYLHFSSLDMTPVRISLVHKVAGKADFPDLVVPRAYVYWVNNFLPSEGPLPSQFSSDHLELKFVDGTGEAWTVAAAERGRREGIDADTAAHRMRAEETMVEISPSSVPTAAFANATRNVSGPAPHRQDDSFEGLAHYRGVSSWSYYVGESSDEFFTARCEGRLHPVYFCSYSTSITEGVVAQVRFVDFRLYGGRAYANRRLRFARQVVCRYLTRC
ncbi:hypothetical protein ACWAT4_12990 [Bradyrhizobium manausense]